MTGAPKPIRDFTAAKAFIVCEGRILFLREAAAYVDGSQIGRYGIPGGRLNSGEDLIDGLKREIGEEAGLMIAQVLPFTETEWTVDKEAEVWRIHAHFFVVVPNEDHVQLSSDHDDFVWLTPEEAVQSWPIMKNLVPMMAELNERFSPLFSNRLKQESAA